MAQEYAKNAGCLSLDFAADFTDRKQYPHFNKLLPRQQQFVLNLVGSEDRFNVTDAYRRAGYKSKNPQKTGVGHKLLKRPKVQAALSEVMCHLGMTPEWIECLIMEIAAGADMADFEPYLQGEKMLGQLRPALKELVRIFGLITEKHEHTIKGGLDLEKMSDDELRRLENAVRVDVEGILSGN